MFNCPEFIKEFKALVDGLQAETKLEVGALSGELMDAVGAVGIDINPQREDVRKCDIRKVASMPQYKGKYDLVFSSGLIEHYTREEAQEVLKAMAKASKKYVLTYVPNSNCTAYRYAKAATDAPWKEELDYTEESLKELHEAAGLTVIKTGTAGERWAERFGTDLSESYLVFCLAEKQ